MYGWDCFVSCCDQFILVVHLYHASISRLRFDLCINYQCTSEFSHKVCSLNVALLDIRPSGRLCSCCLVLYGTVCRHHCPPHVLRDQAWQLPGIAYCLLSFEQCIFSISTSLFLEKAFVKQVGECQPLLTAIVLRFRESFKLKTPNLAWTLWDTVVWQIA